MAGRAFKSEVHGLSIMCALCSTGEVFFQFLDGNNNQVSVQAFIVGLEEFLTRHNSKWRDSHVLLLDNCASHKTPATLRLLQSLGFPVIFSAPASFLAVPIEGLFAALKATDFNKIADPDPAMLKVKKISKLTKKQNLIIKVAEYLFNITHEMISSIYRERFAKL